MAHHRDIMELEQRGFREMLINISQSLTTKDLETLKFYCADFIPLARREDIKSPLQLWAAIMENGRMSSSDTTFLQELLENVIRRRDLLDRVIQYTNSVHMPTQTGNCLNLLLCNDCLLVTTDGYCY